jgi:hypothetical protein
VGPRASLDDVEKNHLPVLAIDPRFHDPPAHNLLIILTVLTIKDSRRRTGDPQHTTLNFCSDRRIANRITLSWATVPGAEGAQVTCRAPQTDGSGVPTERQKCCSFMGEVLRLLTI